MSLPRIGSGAFDAIATKMNDVCTAIGRKVTPVLERHPKVDEFVKAIEPTGANNAFIPMTTLMVGTVIVPRVMTAAKRNPDNKEATQDEIKEILFRDVQTVVIILFLLKILNSIIAGKASKVSGLPMTNKPYQKVFDSNATGLNGISEKTQEFISNPKEKLGKIFQNVKDTIHPTGGVRALTNDEFVSRYSNVSDISDIKKIFNEIKDKDGNPEKIFNRVMDMLVKKQTGLIAQLKGTGYGNISDMEAVLEKLKEVKKAGYSAISSSSAPALDKDVETQLVQFFKDSDNELVKSAKKLNAALRTGALAIESIYLGFGLPALNQKRLEKKYLSNDKNQKTELKNPIVSENKFNPLIDKTMKKNEVKVFKDFVK